MGKSRDISHDNLMNAVDYSSVRSLKRAISSLTFFEKLAGQGNLSAMVILIDLKKALGLYEGERGAVTDKQRQAIFSVYVCGKTQEQVAQEMGLTRQGVGFLIISGLKLIQKFLLEGEVKNVYLDENEKKFFVDYYHKIIRG